MGNFQHTTLDIHVSIYIKSLLLLSLYSFKNFDEYCQTTTRQKTMKSNISANSSALIICDYQICILDRQTLLSLSL